MANETKLVKLEGLKALAERVKQDYATKDSVNTLKNRVDELVTAGGEPNKIDKISVNGTVQQITDKGVDITVPTKVSDLTNDSKYQTDTQVSATVQAAIAASGHACFEKADSIPSVDTAIDNVLYLVMNTKTKHYDIYAKVGTEVVLLDDTTVDLSAYSTTEAINILLDGKVDKVTGKGLSTNDYTTEEKTKLEGLQNYTHPSHTAKASGLYKMTVDALGHVSDATLITKSDITGLGIPEQDTTYVPATASANGLMSSTDKTKLDDITFASSEETQAMLNEVFGA